MRIVYIGNFSELYHEEGRARSFEKIGCDVYRYEEKRFTEDKLKEIIELKPDFVLFAKLKIEPLLKAKIIPVLKENNIKTVSWNPDLYFGLARESILRDSNSIFKADYVLTPDGGHDKEWKELGINHKTLRQGIFDEECKTGKQINVPRIIFVGTENPEFPYRAKLMNYLARKYKSDFGWFGRFNSLEIRDDKLNDLYASAKIVIGDSVYSPHYWSNRIYETIGRGGFIIHPMIEGLDKEYTPYKHFVPYEYNDFKGLFEKIDYFIRNEKERREIAKAGFEYTKQNHTLVNRVKQLLELIK